MYKKLTFRIDKECLHVNKKKDIIPNYFIYKKKPQENVTHSQEKGQYS